MIAKIHILHFRIPFDEVHDKLSYDSLKKAWNAVKDKAKSYFE